MGFFIPLAIGGAKLLGTGAGLTAAGVGLTNLTTQLFPGLPKAVGQDIKSRAGKEVSGFDRSTGQIDYSPTEWLTSVAFGQNLSQLNEATQKASDLQILNSTSDDETLRSELKAAGLDTSEVELRKTESPDNYSARLKTLADKLDRYKAARIENVDPSKLVGEGGRLLSTSEIDAAVTNHRKADPDGPIQRARRAENRDITRHQDSQNLIALQFANSAADRQADREYRRDQQAYQNRRLDLQEARLDRKDRQAAIQQMIAGLAQMGASIAI